MVVFDKGGAGTEEEAGEGAAGKEGAGDGTENEEAKEDGQAGSSGEGGESDNDGGGEGKDDGEGSAAKEGEDEAQGGGMGDLNGFRESLISEVKDIFKENFKANGTNGQEKKEEPKQLTEEEKIEYERQYGMPYAAIEMQERKMGMLFEKIEDMVTNKFSKYDKSESLKALSKVDGYQDAQKYEKGVNEFLERFDKKHHSDPEFLKLAIDASRGKTMREAVTKAHNNGERNRKIAGKFRPASSGGKGTDSVKALTPLQAQVARNHGMDDAEYRKFSGKKTFT